MGACTRVILSPEAPMDLRPHGEQTRARAPAAGLKTWDDFVLLGDDDRRELIDGEFVETEVPTDPHEWIVGMLVHLLHAWALPRRAGVAFPSGYKVRVSARRGVMPDVQFYRKGNPSQRERQGVVRGSPDVAVEVISPASVSCDRVTKLDYYRSIGAKEYWIVDAEHRTFERLVLKGGDYSIVEALREDAVFRPREFEGLEIPLADLWTIPE